MIYQTRGIVLHRTVFADNKAIYHIYTVGEGMRSFLVYTSLKKEKKGQWMKLQPLSVVELKADRRKSESIDYLKSVELEHAAGMESFDYLKSSVRMFLNEVLYKILQTAPPDGELFRYLEESLLLFDRHPFVPDFHLRFLWRLTFFLGCAPVNNFSDGNPFFNIETARFMPVKTDVDSAVSAWIPSWTESLQLPDSASEALPAPFRTPMLECLLAYYVRHVTAAVSTVRSHKVLAEVMHTP